MNDQLNNVLEQLKLEEAKAALVEARTRAVEARLRGEKARAELEKLLNPPKRRKPSQSKS